MRRHPASDNKPAKVARIARRNIVLLLMLGLLVYFLLPQVGEVRMALRDLFHANPFGVLGSLLASAATYIFSALTLRLASGKKIPLRPTIAAQVAASFANLTPASVGGVALAARYLQKQGLPLATAGTAVAMTRVAGLISILLLPFVREPRPHLLTEARGHTVLLVVLGTLLLTAVVLAVPKLRRRGPAVLRQVVDSLRSLAKGRRAPQLVSACLALTVAYGACLYLALLAVGLPADLALMPQVLIVSIVGEGVASAAPTPGGLGAAEASLVSGLLIYAIPTETAVAGVLIYRLATFWLPVVPGFFALRALTGRGYI